MNVFLARYNTILKNCAEILDDNLCVVVSNEVFLMPAIGEMSVMHVGFNFTHAVEYQVFDAFSL